MKSRSIIRWGEIKKRLKGKPEKELLSIMSGCYKLSDEVKYFLTCETSENNEELDRVFTELKGKMSSTFWATVSNGMPLGPKLKEARKIITDVKKITKDPTTIIDFMLLYVEHGIDFTLEYGDMWEGYYISVENMLDKAVKMILKNAILLDKDEYRDRIDEMVERTSRMGWGFNESLTDIAEDLTNTSILK